MAVVSETHLGRTKMQRLQLEQEGELTGWGHREKMGPTSHVMRNE